MSGEGKKIMDRVGERGERERERERREWKRARTEMTLLHPTLTSSPLSPGHSTPEAIKAAVSTHVSDLSSSFIPPNSAST